MPPNWSGEKNSLLRITINKRKKSKKNKGVRNKERQGNRGIKNAQRQSLEGLVFARKGTLLFSCVFLEYILAFYLMPELLLFSLALIYSAILYLFCLLFLRKGTFGAVLPPGASAMAKWDGG